MHAEKCPICDGNGVMAEGPAFLYPTAPICHGCGGKGWVEVNDVPHGWICHPCEPAPTDSPEIITISPPEDTPWVSYDTGDFPNSEPQTECNG
jgi:DnaJ-class molecular chaperone